jgi:hypothetical protein
MGGVPFTRDPRAARGLYQKQQKLWVLRSTTEYFVSTIYGVECRDSQLQRPAKAASASDYHIRTGSCPSSAQAHPACLPAFQGLKKDDSQPNKPGVALLIKAYHVRTLCTQSTCLPT